MKYSDDEVNQMDRATAEVELSHAIYEAAYLVEQLEFLNKLDGNGHQIRQRIADFARELRASWWSEADL